MFKEIIIWAYSLYFISFGGYEAYLCRNSPTNLSDKNINIYLFIGISSILNIMYGVNYIIRIFKKLFKSNKYNINNTNRINIEQEIIKANRTIFSFYYFKLYWIRNFIRLLKISFGVSSIYFFNLFQNSKITFDYQNIYNVIIIEIFNSLLIILVELLNFLIFKYKIKRMNYEIQYATSIDYYVS